MSPFTSTRRTVLFLAAALALAPGRAGHADEGMWTLDNFPKQAVRQKYGVDVSDAWLEHVRLSSVRLEEGCSGSFVSPEGLVLTNHHCVNSCIQQLSSAERDLLAMGFLAKTPAGEVPCDTQEVSVLVGTEDVSARVAAAAKGAADGGAANRAQKAEMTRIEKACEAAAPGGGDTYLCQVTELYHGGQHWLHKYRRYRDVRLVFAPEIAIANFGGDPDNFNFPRYDLDMALVRAYDGGKPAKTPQYLKWNAAGAQEGDPVFVSGHPGATNRLLTVAQLETLRDVALPMRLLLASELRGRLIQFGKTGPEPLRIIQDNLLNVENGIKVRKGQLQALLDDDLFGKKQAEERDLRARVAADPAQHEAGSAWDEIAKAEEVYRAIYPRYRLVEQGSGFDSALFNDARRLVRAAAERGKPNEERLREYTESQMPSLEQENASKAPVYPELEELRLSFSLEKLREWLGPDDPLVKEVLGKESPDALAHQLVAGSKLADPEVRKRLWAGGEAAIEASDDPMIRLALAVDDDARAVRKTYEDEVEGPEAAAAERLAKARFAAQGTSVYPDATFTLRLTYGAVKGWNEGGKAVVPFTTFGGVFERATGKDPFALPASWLEAKPRLDLATRFNFVADTDIIGGNSGSPMIDKEGRIVGLVFDGNIHSIGGAYGFDPSVNRSVAVHSGGILEALKKVYRADHLVEEIERAAK